MIGWLTLIEAEELSRDVTGGASWREPVAPEEISGAIVSVSPPSKSVIIEADDLEGSFLLYNDVPFKVMSRENPGTSPQQYLIDRTVNWPIGGPTVHYKLDDENSRNRFDAKRAALFDARDRIVGLAGYGVTEMAAPSDDLKRAQLLTAIAFWDGELSQNLALQAAGVKRQKLGDAETEFRDSATAPRGMPSEALNLLAAYKTGVKFTSDVCSG